MLYTKQERQCTYKRNTEMHSSNHSCCGRAIHITYSECVSTALVIQKEKRMRPTILSCVACLALPVLHVLINGMIFEKKKKVTEHKMCVLIFSKICLKHFSFYDCTLLFM